MSKSKLTKGKIKILETMIEIIEDPSSEEETVFAALETIPDTLFKTAKVDMMFRGLRGKKDADKKDAKGNS